jgi:hypothetical protein
MLEGLRLHAGVPAVDAVRDTPRQTPDEDGSFKTTHTKTPNTLKQINKIVSCA